MLVFEQSNLIDECDTGFAPTVVTKLILIQKPEGLFAVAANGSVTADMAKKITAASTNTCRHAHRPLALGTFNNTRLRAITP